MRNHKVLLGFLPLQRHGLARLREVRDLTRPHHVLHKLPPQRLHPHRGPVKHLPVSHGFHDVLPGPQGVPVEHPPKAVVDVTTRAEGINALQAVGDVIRAAVNFQDHVLGVTHPARQRPDAALPGVGRRVLQIAGGGLEPVELKVGGV